MIGLLSSNRRAESRLKTLAYVVVIACGQRPGLTVIVTDFGPENPPKSDFRRPI
jgi:hypothetical protein